MSSVQSSTSTISSPYATVKEQIRPARVDGGEGDAGTLGGSLKGIGGAIADGASATVTLSERALGAIEDAVEHGAAEIGGAAMAAYATVRNGVASAVDGIEHAAVDAWHGMEHLAADGVHGIEKGAGELEHLGSEAWTAIEHGAHRAKDYAVEVGQGIGTAAGYVGDGLSEVADGVGNVAGRMASYATVGAAAIERAFSAVV